MNILAIYRDGVLFPFRRHNEALSAAFETGDKVSIDIAGERTEATHNHEFAWIKTAFDTLPENMPMRFSNAEHLRKFALIRCGYCVQVDHVCKSAAEAERVAAMIAKHVDKYALVETAGPIVRVFEAESQSKRKMGAKRFQESKTAILDYISGLLGVEPGQLEKAA